MKIAYIVGGFPAISETFIVNQIAGMVARGEDVDILVTAKRKGKTPHLPEAVVRHKLMERVLRIGAPRNFLLRLLRLLPLLLAYGWREPGVVMRSVNIARYGKSAARLALLYTALTLIRHGTRQYDVIHAQFGSYGPLALQLVEIGALQGSIVTSFRGSDATKYLQAHPHVFDQLFRAGRCFLPVSQALAKRIVEAGCDPARIRVHHSGIQCDRFYYRERVRDPDEMTKVLLVGRLVEKKGMGYALQAIGQVIASGRKVSATIIGDGPLRAALQQQIHELGIHAHISMVGSRSHDEVLAMMANSHILMAPSVTAGDGDEEGIPNTLKEAMALGLPVISTVHAGIPELVDDRTSGFLVPERDSSALAERLMQLVDHPETWATMGRAGRARIDAEFCIEKLCDELQGLYRVLLESPEQYGVRT